jgi:hypothetical protein
MVRDARDHSEMGMKGFLSFLKGTASFLFALAKGILLSPLALGRFFFNLFRHRLPVPDGEALGWKEKLARVLDGHDATQGFSYILRNKTLSVLLLVGAVEGFLADAMPMVVLPISSRTRSGRALISPCRSSGACSPPRGASSG